MLHRATLALILCVSSANVAGENDSIVFRESPQSTTEAHFEHAIGLSIRNDSDFSREGSAVEAMYRLYYYTTGAAAAGLSLGVTPSTKDENADYRTYDLSALLRMQAFSGTIRPFAETGLSSKWYKGKGAVRGVNEQRFGMVLAFGMGGQLSKRIALEFSLRFVINQTERHNYGSYSPAFGNTVTLPYGSDLYNPTTFEMVVRFDP